MDAAAAGTEPDAELAPGAVKGLAGDGLRATPSVRARSRSTTCGERSRVVSSAATSRRRAGQRVDQWDVPSVSDGYAAAREHIVAQVERLVAELAAGR